jgi:predicted O-methyltransferase YrrM
MDDLDRILELIESIPERMCGGLQPRFLYELSRATAGPVVEIGTCAGKSTIALAYGQKVRNGHPVTTIDLLEHEQIEANLRRAGVDEWVRRVVDESTAVARRWVGDIGLLWIDGDHSYKGVVRDISAWSPLVRQGGLMAFHDYPAPGGHEMGSVGHAVFEKVLSRPDVWKVVSDREAGSIIVFEKLTDGSDRPSYAATAVERLLYGATRFTYRAVRRIRGRFRGD